MSTNCTKHKGKSLCVALPGFHSFTGSNYTASFNHKGKIRPLLLLERNEDAKKAFFCFERTIGRKKITSFDKAWLDFFLKNASKTKITMF